MAAIRIGITGASGFVGQHLSAYLKHIGAEVVDLQLRSGYHKALLNGLSAVIHLAGKAHDLKGEAKLDEYIAVNTTLTAKLYTDFLESNVPVFCYMSSVKAVADHPTTIVSEEMLAEPRTSYGISKQQAEAFILANTPSPSKRVYILRPCMIHGPGNKGNLNLLYRFVQKGIPYPLAAFENERSFLSVENLCHVIDQLIRRSDILPGIYHLADSGTISTNRLIKLIGETLERKPMMLAVPRFLIKGLAKIGDVLSLPMNSHTLHKLTENYVVSNEKIVRALGHTLPIDLETGLKKTISSFTHAD